MLVSAAKCQSSKDAALTSEFSILGFSTAVPCLLRHLCTFEGQHLSVCEIKHSGGLDAQVNY